MFKHLNFPLSPRSLSRSPRGRKASSEEVKRRVDTLSDDEEEAPLPTPTGVSAENLQPGVVSVDWLLECAVLEARDIAVGDRRTQSSDGFVRVRFGKNKACTSVQHKTLEPKWEQTFSFQFKARIDETGDYVRVEGADSVIKFVLYDKDLFRNDLLGTASVDINTWKTGSMQVKWLPLEVKGGKGTQGEIKVGLHISPKDAAEVKSKDLRTLEEVPAEDSAEDPANPRPGGRGSLSEVAGNAKRSTVRVEEVSRFDLTVVAAKDLPSKDSNKLSDPYCIVKVGREKHKTHVVPKTLDPSWNCTFAFGESRKLRLKPDAIVELSVYDKDGTFDRNDLIGQASLPLADLFNNNAPSWITLKYKRKEIPAKISLSATIIQEQEIKPKAVDKKGAAIKVSVLRGSDLLAADKRRSSDPYCVLQFGKKRFKTQAKKRTLDPDWGECFTLNLPAASKPTKEQHQDLIVKVMDKDGFFDRDDLLGQLRISQPDIIRRAKASKQEWLDLDSQGRVLLKFELAPLLQESPKDTQELLLENRRSESRIEDCHLHVHVVEADNLNRITGASKGMDPYCILKVGEKKLQTKVVSNSTCPFWDQLLRFDQPLTEQTLVAVELRDKDILTSKLLARKELSLATLRDMASASSSGEIWVELQDIKKPPRVKMKLLFVPVINRSGTSFKSQKGEAAVEAKASFERMKVKVIEARGLKASDRNGLADPYCVVRVGSVKRSTSAQKRTLSPKWSDTAFEFSKDLTSEQTIIVQVYDQDFAFDRNDLMGSLQIPLSSLDAISTRWYTLTGKNHKQRGEVKIEVELISSTRSPEDILCAIADKLHSFASEREKQLDLCETFDLYDKDNSGRLEAAEFQEMLKLLGADIKQEELSIISELFDVDGDGLVDYKEFLAVIRQPASQTADASADIPSVLHTVLAKLFAGIKGEKAVEQTVLKLRRTFELFDRSGSGRFRLEQGNLSVEFNKVLGLAGLSQVRHLSDQEVLRSHFVDEDDDTLIDYEALCKACSNAQGEPLSVEVEEEGKEGGVGGNRRRSGPDRDSAPVFVEVVAAQGLCAVDRNGQSDPFCVLQLQHDKSKTKTKMKPKKSIGKFKAKTRVVKDELNPTWNQRFVLSPSLAALPEDGDLHVEVKDSGTLFHQSLGHASIPLSMILAELTQAPHFSHSCILQGKRASGSIELSFGIESSRNDLLTTTKHGRGIQAVEETEAKDSEEEVEQIARISSAQMKYSPQARDEEELWKREASPSAITLDSIREAVSRVAHTKTMEDKGLFELFQDADGKQKGWLRQRAFLASLEHYGIVLSKAEIDFLMPRLDPEDREELDYLRFCRLVGAAVFTEDTLRQKLRQAIESCKNAGVSVEAIFQAFDVQRRGLLTERDFFRGVSALGVTLDRNQRQILVEMRNQAPSGYVKYMPLLRHLYPELSFDNDADIDAGRSGRLDGVISHLRRRLLSKKNGKHGNGLGLGLTLCERFERVDRQGEGRVSLREFRRVLRQVDRGIPEEQLQLLVKAFDCDKDGYIDYTELVEAIGEDGAGKNSVGVEAIRQKLGHVVAGNAESLAKAFDRHDLNGDGKLSRRVFRRVLATSEHSLTHKELRIFMDALDPSRLGFIHIPKFFEVMGLDSVMRAFDDATLVRAPRHRGYIGEVPSIHALAQGSRGVFTTPTKIMHESKRKTDSIGSIWEPAFVQEWLEKAATPTERRAYDRLQRASTKAYMHGGSSATNLEIEPRHDDPLSPQREVGEGGIYDATTSPHRPLSPAFRHSQQVGWECPTCTTVNRKPSCLNACEMCGTVRSAKVNIIVGRDEDSLGSGTDASSITSVSYKGQRRRSDRRRRSRGRGRSREKRPQWAYSSSSESVSEEPSALRRRSHSSSRNLRGRHRQLRKNKRKKSRRRPRSSSRRESWNAWVKYGQEEASSKYSARARSPGESHARRRRRRRRSPHHRSNYV